MLNAVLLNRYTTFNRQSYKKNLIYANNSAKNV